MHTSGSTTMLLRSGATLLAGILLAGLFVSASSATSVPVGSVTTAGTGLPDSVSRVHAQAAGDPAGVVSAVPSASTPDVEDGAVLDIAVVGSTALAVGSFSRVTSAVGDTSVARDSVVAFDATTGEVDAAFSPRFNGPVTSVALAGDGASVFLAGGFTKVNGVAAGVVRLDLDSGEMTAGFSRVRSDGLVKTWSVTRADCSSEARSRGSAAPPGPGWQG
ncbi:MAG: hypothetical protein H0U62_02365 [Actinobacteria bacterium]|nr:hypothetical protein [Actinomycetota bacterium]